MLDLNVLANGHIPAITPSRGGVMGETAGLCLESHSHPQGVLLQVQGGSGRSYALYWPIVTNQTHLTYDMKEATEEGSVGVAILLIMSETGLRTVERSVIGTGVDYWLGTGSTPPFEYAARLEISGIFEGSESAIRARVKQKLNQTRRSVSSGLQAYVIVVEFSRPIAEVRKI